MASWQDDGWALRMIREEVFVHEQHVPVELEWDTFDASCIHMLAMDSRGNPIGTARLLLNGTIGRMAVLKGWRRKGVGSALVLGLLEEARKRHLQQVVLNAQTYVTHFYTKFDFQIVGDEFLDAGILHTRMTLRLGNPAD